MFPVIYMYLFGNVGGDVWWITYSQLSVVHLIAAAVQLLELTAHLTADLVPPAVSLPTQSVFSARNT